MWKERALKSALLVRPPLSLHLLNSEFVMKKFIIEFRLKPGGTRKVMELFELAGPKRTSGVALRDAWLGTREELIFVLCESAEEQFVAQACAAWNEYGECRIHPVIHHEQY